MQRSLSFRPANAHRVELTADLSGGRAHSDQLIIQSGDQLFMLLTPDERAAGRALIATHHGRAGASEQLGRLFAVPRELVFNQAFVGDSSGGCFHCAGDRGIHFADRLAEHRFRRFESLHDVIQVCRNDVADACKYSHDARFLPGLICA